jgi:hypothetical protein
MSNFFEVFFSRRKADGLTSRASRVRSPTYVGSCYYLEVIHQPMTVT